MLDLINKFKFENTTEFGCIQSFIHKKKEYSCSYLNVADRINKLSKFFNFGKIQTFFEIGGGFGANIHFLITNFPNIKNSLFRYSPKHFCWYRILNIIMEIKLKIIQI